MARRTALLALLSLVTSMPAPADTPTTPPADPPRALHVVLVGASIGRAWKLSEFAARTARAGVTIEYVGLYRFDKSDAVREVLGRADGRPDVLVLKECGSYFPGDAAAYRALIATWVDASAAAGVVPVLATVPPVAAPAGLFARAKDLVKRALLRRESQGEAIARFNDWVRGYAAERGLLVLDLEAALRVSDHERVLAPGCDGGDGLHLNDDAYRRLDAAMAALLDRLDAA